MKINDVIKQKLKHKINTCNTESNKYKTIQNNFLNNKNKTRLFKN